MGGLKLPRLLSQAEAVVPAAGDGRGVVEPDLVFKRGLVRLFCLVLEGGECQPVDLGMTWPTSVGWVGVVLLCFGCGEEMSCGVVNCVEGASGELCCGDSCRRSCYWIVLGVDLGGGIEYSNEIQQRRMVL